MPIKGKQIATGVDGIGSTNMVPGALSADATGRAIMAANVFDSATVTAKFEDMSIPTSKLADPTVSKNWKELLLVADQVLDGAAGGLLQAMACYIVTLPTAGDTFIITDGVAPETYLWQAGLVNPFDVLIGIDAAASQANLITAINTDSLLWTAVATTGLDNYFAGLPAGQVVIHRKIVSALADRIYGVITAPDGVKVVSFADPVAQDYEAGSGTEISLPAADPAAKRFGPGRAVGALVTCETHVISEDNTNYTWDADDQVWRQTGVGAVAYEVVGNITALAAAKAAGTNNTIARGDHAHIRDAEDGGEVVTSEVVVGADTALADGLDHLPLASTEVSLFLNGVLLRQGATFDYTLAGQVITVLCNTGTCPDLVVADVIQARYRWQGV
uniref:Tail protein n=1 Tax=viral metagenome TaxID=1070528 RepID=A0A6H1Z7W0_9ZZZZ